MQNKQEASDRALIRRLMKPKRRYVNEHYMGSQAVAGLYHILGLKYGAGDFNAALKAASREKLDELLKKCAPYLPPAGSTR